MKKTILEVKDLTVSFRTADGMLRAVRDISFRPEKGKTLAIVGESGSGKSVTSKAILGILAGNAMVEGGEIHYGGQDLLKASEEELCRIRGDQIAMIFQDPLSSLNPIVKIGKQLTEAMLIKNKAGRRRARQELRRLQRQLQKADEGVKPMLQQAILDAKARSEAVLTPAQAKEKALKLMEEVGIPEPERRFYQYPFEFSGGMRQRIVIAIALSSQPEILICDEPTTALDVTIQAQILELIHRLKQERGLSVIFITHDLGVVANMADEIAVMYAGKIVEKGTAEEIFYDPRHPYTWALLSAMPDLHTKGKLSAIPGTPPDMLRPPVGDAFAARNPYAMEIDYLEQPPAFSVSDTHWAATWLLHPDAPKVALPEQIRSRIQRMKGGGGCEAS
jgi:oligopeptide transport system ATP-binding protein